MSTATTTPTKTDPLEETHEETLARLDAMQTAVRAGAAYRHHPGAEVASYAPPRTPAWFATRRTGITATDARDVIGEGYERTALNVYLDKFAAEPDRPDSDRMYFGRKIEPVIIESWAERHGTSVLPMPIIRSTVHRHRGQLWMLASPDGGVYRCPDGDGPCGLQVKNLDHWAAGTWRHEVPDPVLAQCTWEAATAGWGHEHVAALIGGNRMIAHRVDVNPKILAYLLREAAAVWSCVLDQTPPQVDPSWRLTRLLDRMFPDRSGCITLDPEQLADWHARWIEWGAVAAGAKGAREAIRDEIVAALGTGVEAAPGDGLLPVVSWRQQPEPTLTVNAEQLRRLQAEHPYTYRRLIREKYTTASQPRKIHWTPAASALHTEEEGTTDD